MIDTNKPLSREELALFHSRMMEEFNTKNAALQDILAKVNTISERNLAQINRIDKVIKDIKIKDKANIEVDEENKDQWIQAANYALSLLYRKSLSDANADIINGILLITKILENVLYNGVADSERLEKLFSDGSCRQLFEEIIILIMKRLDSDRFSLIDYMSYISYMSDAEKAELNDSDIKEEIDELFNDNVIDLDNLDNLDNKTHESSRNSKSSKSAYRSIPAKVDEIIYDFAIRNGIKYSAATSKLYRAIENKGNIKLSQLKKDFISENNIPYCTTAFMISEVNELYELLKAAAEEQI